MDRVSAFLIVVMVLGFVALFITACTNISIIGDGNIVGTEKEMWSLGVDVEGEQKDDEDG
jgi:hypothetical protein